MKRKNELKSAVRFFAVILVAGIFLTSVAFGEEVTVPEVKVTYTRDDQDPAKIPGSVTVIDRETIDKSGATSVPELLKREAGINFHSVSGIETMVGMDMRGYARGYNTLVMVNGVRVTPSDLSTVDFNLIPLEAVEKIEIVRGPGSSLWGNSAVSGVVNIITRRDFDGLFLKTGYKFGSWGNHEGILSAGYSNDMGRLFLSVDRKHADGERYNKYYNFRSSYYDSLNFTLSGALTPTEIFELTVDLGYDKSEYGFPGVSYEAGRSAFGNDYSDLLDKGKGESFYINTGVKFDFDDYGRVMLNYTFRNSNGWLYQPDPPHDYMQTYSYLTEHGISGKYVLDLEFGDLNNRFTAGVDYLHSEYELSFAGFWLWDWPPWTPVGLSITQRDTKSVRESIGYYLYDEFTLFDKLVLSVGYRYEMMKMRYDWVNIDMDDHPFFTPLSITKRGGNVKYSEKAVEAGLTYMYGEGNKVYFSYAQGFRLPLIDEIIDYNGINIDLKPEKAVSYELGVLHHFTPDIYASLDLYWMNIKNEIYVDPTAFSDGRVSNVNFPKTVHRGLELKVVAKPLDWLSLYTAWAFQDAYFDTWDLKGKTLPYVPKHTINFGFGVDYEGFAYNMDCRYASERIRDGDYNNIQKRLDNSFVMDMRVGYTYTIKDKYNVEIFTGVNNVTGEYHSDFGGYTDPFGSVLDGYFDRPLSGRYFYGGVNFSF